MGKRRLDLNIGAEDSFEDETKRSRYLEGGVSGSDGESFEQKNRR